MRRECNLLLGLILLLVTIGIVSVYSANAAQTTLNDRFLHHMKFVGAGLVVLAVAAHFDYRLLGKLGVMRFIVLMSLVLLVAVLVPGIGDVRGGARRWIEIGPVSFQPSEFAKFALILFLADTLARNQEYLGDLKRVVLPCFGAIVVFAGLIVAERDLGTPAVLTAAAFCVLMLGGMPWKYLSAASLVGLAGASALIFSSEFRTKRMLAFLDPWSHREEEGYQLIQSMTAFVNGGIWGQGPGGGEQKLHYLPEAHTDFIYAVWGEETGLIGSIILALVFLGVLALSLRIAMNAKELFGTLLAGGAVSLIALQALFNMMVAVGLLPTKGLPLPFISMGGTSLLVLMGLMGIVINVGLQAEPIRRRAMAVRAA